MLNDKTILITGGTGSLGKEIVKSIFSEHENVKKVIIYSRDEQKQYEMAKEWPVSKYPKIRFFIGDVRDRDRLIRAFEGVDIVIHAAAMKHVDIAEYNPDECIKTNIGGAENVIHAALNKNVRTVVALSTDKACAPINLYGATKLTSDKLFVAANNIKGDKQINFSVVRYGNVLGSNGSVVPYFNNIKDSGVFPITHIDMTRFNISLKEGVGMIFYAIENSLGGEIFIPKIPSYKITDVAKAIDSTCEIQVVGIRPGEKLHEEMISASDSFNTFELKDHYVILPAKPNFSIDLFLQKFKAKRVVEGFSYNSLDNSQWETVESLKDKISKLNLR
ncbi:UDP-N-acetylglucosamine 4,6-dehydratase (inverting) [Flavobacteriaceae bacterium LSUCC0859]|nr:UDP-N-acetylglucosamine 4,6-dehydratase (inverting) [Flavobacteriaceae bacterium LSUCC0859]